MEIHCIVYQGKGEGVGKKRIIFNENPFQGRKETILFCILIELSLIEFNLNYIST